MDDVLRIMNKSGNPSENVFPVHNTGDPATTKVKYETKRSQQMAEKKNNGKESVNSSKPRENMISSTHHFLLVYIQRLLQDSIHRMARE